MPSGLSLGQNYSNPFNPATLVALEFPAATHVSLVSAILRAAQWPSSWMDTFLPVGTRRSGRARLAGQTPPHGYLHFPAGDTGLFPQHQNGAAEVVP